LGEEYTAKKTERA